MQPAQQIRVVFTVEPSAEDPDAGGRSPHLEAATDAVQRAGLTAATRDDGNSVQGPIHAVSQAMADLVRSAMDSGATSVSLTVARTV
jgi:hypothetical protein